MTTIRETGNPGSIFIRVSSCDFVDRLLHAPKERSTKSHELTGKGFEEDFLAFTYTIKANGVATFSAWLGIAIELGVLTSCLARLRSCQLLVPWRDKTNASMGLTRHDGSP
jgi:hypothetical protein